MFYTRCKVVKIDNKGDIHTKYAWIECKHADSGHMITLKDEHNKDSHDWFVSEKYNVMNKRYLTNPGSLI